MGLLGAVEDLACCALNVPKVRKSSGFDKLLSLALAMAVCISVPMNEVAINVRRFMARLSRENVPKAASAEIGVKLSACTL